MKWYWFFLGPVLFAIDSLLVSRTREQKQGFKTAIYKYCVEMISSKSQ